MKVMSNHVWHDNDILEVLLEEDEDKREVVLKPNTEAIVIHREDVIALAKEFDLIVFDEDDRL